MICSFIELKYELASILHPPEKKNATRVDGIECGWECEFVLFWLP